MFREGRALRKFFRLVFLQRHMPDTPGVERDFERRFEWRARRVFDLEKRFHQLRRFPVPLRTAKSCRVCTKVAPLVAIAPSYSTRKNKSSSGLAPTSAKSIRARKGAP